MSSTPSDIFLSYSRDDLKIARRFAEGFERAGFSVWWDQSLNAGEAYDNVTERALKDAKAVVVLWSGKSVASRWVRAEATQADRNRTLVPAMIEACERPIMFELTHTADLCHWKGDADDKAWLAFVNDVQRFVRKETTGSNSEISAPRPRRKRWLYLEFPVLLLLAASIAAWTLLRPGHSAKDNGGTPQTTASVPATAAVSLAVLPFVNLSSDPEQEYFSDGLTEELLNQLAQNKELRVTGRTSSFAYKGKNVDLRVIGEQLGVGNILEGSVRKSGNQLRITAQLIKASDGSHLFSRTYDRDLNDVFAIQGEIATAVSDALSITLDVGAMSRARGGTSNLDAYDNYLRARNLDRNRGNRDDLVTAAEYYRKSVAQDPLFIRAWTDLHLELQAWLIYVPDRAQAARADMKTIGARLNELAPDSTYNLNIRASTMMDEHRWADAKAALDAVVAAGGDFRQDITSNDSAFLLATGRIQEVIANTERRVQSDPLSLNASYGKQITLYLAGRPQDSLAEYARGRTLVGDQTLIDQFALLTLRKLDDNKSTELATAWQRYLQHPSARPLDRTLFAQANNPEAARASVRQALTDPSLQTATDMIVLATYADSFDDSDSLLAALRRAYVDYGGTNIGMLWQPFRHNVHNDPRFKAILRDLKLVDYFRQSGNWGDFCKPVDSEDFECH